MFIWHTVESETQTGSETSYIGGVPKLPRGMSIPVFKKTGTEMTFFFQLECPVGHIWAGRILSVFSATDYVDDDSFIPKLPNPLAGAELNDDFFRDYQSFFRIISYDAAQEIELVRYSQKIAFHQLEFAKQPPAGTMTFGEINDAPNWMLDDESPASFNGRQDLLHFLFQTKLDYEFLTIPSAPRQKVIDYGSEAGLTDSEGPNYTLFTSNELYFFGVKSSIDLIYVVPQS